MQPSAPRVTFAEISTSLDLGTLLATSQVFLCWLCVMKERGGATLNSLQHTTEGDDAIDPENGGYLKFEKARLFGDRVV